MSVLGAHLLEFIMVLEFTSPLTWLPMGSLLTGLTL